MRINKIEIIGFKSFKDKTILDFKDSVTGIVGPNGCGKSNVVDALLWVMGETAPKHLRSSSMSDVIFSGTHKKNPSPSAQVSLFLKKEDDGVFPQKYKDFSEIMISRRLTRKGDSEYSINQQPCLLRDIQEIFMDTGAGCRGFSIIEQDAIEKLVTSKPQERRFIIEEVAGITKFKTRKTESIRKLDRVNQNLQRVDDIIKTQEKQLNQLSRQAKKAEQYRKIKEEIRTKEWELSDRLLKKIDEEQEELKDQEASENKRRDEIKIRKEEAQGRLKVLQQEIQEKETLLDKDQSYLSELNCKIVEHRKDIEKCNMAIQIYKDSIQSDRDSHKNSLKEIEQNEKHLEQFEKEYKKLQSKKEMLTEDFNEIQVAFKLNPEKETELSNKKEELDLVLQNKRKEKVEEHVKKQFIEAYFATRKTEEAQLQDELDSTTEQIRKTIREKTQLSDAIKKSQNKKWDLSKETSQIVKMKEDLTRKKQQIQKEREELQENTTRLTYKIQGMQSLVHKLEGFDHGTQNLLKWDSKRFKPLFKEIKIEAGFEEATEATLGSYIQTLIPQDKTSIDEGIQYLKENQKGKSGFLSSLPIHRDTSIEKEDLKKYPAFICFLSDKIQFSLEVENLNLIASQTVVVSNLSSAFELKAQFPSLQFVTKTGERITKESFVYGGSHKDEVQLLKVQNQIKESTNELKSAQRNLDIKQSEYKDTIDRLNKIRPGLDKINSSDTQLEVLIASSNKELEQLDKDTLRLTGQKDQLQSKKQDQDLIYKEKQENFESINKKHESLEQAINNLESELSQAESSYKEYQDLKNKKIEIETKILEASTEQKAFEKNKALVTESIHKLKHKNKDILKNHEVLADKIKKEEFNIENIEKELSIYLEDKEQVEALVLKQQDDFQSKKEGAEAQTELLNKIYEEQTLFEKQQNEFHAEYEKLELQKQNLKEKLFENHQIKIDTDVLIPVHDEMPLEDLKSLTQKLHEKITKISEVNLIALKEYEELEKEFNFLSNQREDLFNSQKELKKIIRHTDELCETRFKEMLNEINLRFSRVFPIIFEGDDAEARLVLVEKEGNEEDGVDIIVRPPGKRPQNVSLLSRGEKALTSLCLIYSLFLVKPSPFCILDEIDAPLDDANVSRFISILKEMARKSQLIVITHNKYTMKACSQLYGVTMAQKGISQVVSVDSHNLQVNTNQDSQHLN